MRRASPSFLTVHFRSINGLSVQNQQSETYPVDVVTPCIEISWHYLSTHSFLQQQYVSHPVNPKTFGLPLLFRLQKTPF